MLHHSKSRVEMSRSQRQVLMLGVVATVYEKFQATVSDDVQGFLGSQRLCRELLYSSLLD